MDGWRDGWRDGWMKVTYIASMYDMHLFCVHTYEHACYIFKLAMSRYFFSRVSICQDSDRLSGLLFVVLKPES